MLNLFEVRTNPASRGVLLSAALLTASITAVPALTGDAHASTVNTTTHKEHDFNNDRLGPFTEDQGLTNLREEGMTFTNDGRGGKRLKLTWKESEYDGTRRERGHEIKLNVTTNDELFTGFNLNIPSGQNNNLLNKNTIIWQLYNWNSDGCSNWTAHMELKNDDLYLSYRAACVDPTVVKIYDNVPTNRDLAFQIRSDISGNNTGRLVVWIDDIRRANVRNANFGFGSFNNNDNANTSVVGVKMGMYNFDFNNYTDNETRILYLDNVGVTVRTGSVANSYEMIDPRNM